MFANVTLSARCPSAFLHATATPPATAATSQVFAVTPRGCDVAVRFAVTDTISATVEEGDCIVMRGGRQFFAHTYILTIPPAPSAVPFRLNTVSSGFAPRVESYVWPHDPSAYRVDSLVGAGTLASSYWLPSGSHRFVVTSAFPDGTGAYSRTNDFNPDLSNAVLGCVVHTGVGVSISSGSGLAGGGECSRSFVSRPGVSQGQHFVLYQRAGQPVEVTLQAGPSNTGTDIDPYLEVFDVTNTSSLTSTNLVIFDDNSGGGPLGFDAQLTVPPAPNGRFILIRAARVGMNHFPFLLTISE